MSDLTEIRVADHLVNRAHFKHDHIVSSSRQTFRYDTGLDELGAKDIQDGIEDELDKLYPVALVDHLINTVDTGSDEMPLVRRGASFQGTGDVVGFH